MRANQRRSTDYVQLRHQYGILLSVLSQTNAVFTGDMDSLKRDLEDPARPMKSSAFASEEPAPFTPVSLKGFLFLFLSVMFPVAVYCESLQQQ